MVMNMGNKNGAPDEAAVGKNAIQTLLHNNSSNPNFVRYALEQACRDPLLDGMYTGSESIRTDGTVPAGRDIRTGVGLALIAIDLCNVSTTGVDSVPEFIPNNWEVENAESMFR